jgi:hypothetical protein
MHMSLEIYRKRILSLFTIDDVIKNTLREPRPGVWIRLHEDVPKWWEFYKAWEAQDTVEKAYKEQRLTVKAVAINTPYMQDLGAKELIGGTWSDKKQSLVYMTWRRPS